MNIDFNGLRHSMAASFNDLSNKIKKLEGCYHNKELKESLIEAQEVLRQDIWLLMCLIIPNCTPVWDDIKLIYLGEIEDENN